MYPIIGIVFFLAALGLGVVSLKGNVMPGLIFFSFSIGLESLILGLLNQKIGVWQIIATIVVIAATSLAEIRSRKIPRTAFFITLIAVTSVLGIALFSATWVLITLIVVAVIAMFCSPKGSSCGRTKRIILLVLAIATILFVCVLSLMTFTPRQTSSTAASETTVVPTTTPETTVAVLTPLDAVINDMRQNGGGELGIDYVIGDDVDPKLDTSTTGSGAFNPDGIRTPEAMVSWLKEKTTRGLANITETQTATEASESQIFEVSNWFVLQALVDGKLTGNTGFVDGNLVFLGEREIKKGDIFLVFVNPENLKMIYFRGACANPQGFTPQLGTPTPTPTPTKTPTETTTPTTEPTTPTTAAPTPTPAPKSTNPADYKQPGDGTEKDSGIGTMPTSPTTPDQGQAPAPVDTTPAKPILAPSATPVPTQAPSATPTPTPVLANPFL